MEYRYYQSDDASTMNGTKAQIPIREERRPKKRQRINPPAPRSPDERLEKAKRALETAIHKNDWNLVKELVVRDPVAVRAVASGFDSPLFLALTLNKTEMIAELLAVNFPVKDIVNRDGRTLLGVAAEYTNMATIALLAKCGSDVNQEDLRDPKPPLFHAVKVGNVNAVKVLIKLGARVTTTTVRIALQLGNDSVNNALLGSSEAYKFPASMPASTLLVPEGKKEANEHPETVRERLDEENALLKRTAMRLQAAVHEGEWALAQSIIRTHAGLVDVEFSPNMDNHVVAAITRKGVRGVPQALGLANANVETIDKDRSVLTLAAEDETGRTSAVLATKSGLKEALKRDRIQALLTAVRSGNIEVVRALLQAGTKVDKSLLKVALSQNDSKSTIVGLLRDGMKLAGNVPADAKQLFVKASRADPPDPKAVINAASSNSAELEKAILNSDYDTLKTVLNRDSSALEVAVIDEKEPTDDRDEPAIVAKLAGTKLDREALHEINARVNELRRSGRSILGLAAEHANGKTVALLLSRGAVVDSLDRGLVPALYHAVRANNLETVRTLLSAGAKCSRQIMDIAMTHADRSIVERLLQTGADPVGLQDEAFTDPSSVAAGAPMPASDVVASEGKIMYRYLYVDKAHTECEPGAVELVAKAIRGHDHSRVKRLIVNDPRLAESPFEGVCPLFQAIATDSPTVVQVILDGGVTLLQYDVHKRTPLTAAADCAGPQVIAKLIPKDCIDIPAYINQRDANGIPAIMYAVRSNNLRVARFLILRGAEIDTSMIRWAKEHGNRGKMIDVLLHGTMTKIDTRPGLPPLDARTDLGAPPVFLSNPKSATSDLSQLAIKQSNAAQDAVSNATPYGVLEAEKKLPPFKFSAQRLRHGGDELALRVEGTTHLMVAANASNLAAVKALLDGTGDARLNDVDSMGRTPLTVAVLAGHTEMVQLLIARGAHVSPNTAGAWSPLHAAAQIGRADLMRLLLDKKADPNYRDDSGATPIHYVASRGDAGLSALELLLAARADPTLATYTGETGLDVALTDPNSKHIVARLKRAVAEKNAELRNDWLTHQHKLFAGTTNELLTAIPRLSKDIAHLISAFAVALDPPF